MTAQAHRSTVTHHGAAVPDPTGTAAPSLAGTNATAGAGRIAAAFGRAAADGRAALIPYVVAGYPDHEASFAAALAAADAGADLLEVGPTRGRRNSAARDDGRTPSRRHAGQIGGTDPGHFHGPPRSAARADVLRQPDNRRR